MCQGPYKYYDFIFAVLCHFIKYLHFFEIERKQRTLANCKFLTTNSNHVWHAKAKQQC